MTKRDAAVLSLLLTALFVLFAPLLLRPWLMPGSFGDYHLYHYPLRHLVASRLEQGQLPLWNPHIFAGVPLAANPQAVLLYPGSLLHYVLPLAWALSLDAWLHASAAVAGAFLLLRTWRLDRGGAALLATAYGLSPFLIYRVSQGVPTHLAALAWAPWVWLAALTKHPFPIALTFGLQVLSGHPQFALVNAIGLGAWGLVKDPRRAIALIPAAALGLFLAAAQVLPTLEYLGLSVRKIWDPGLALGYSMRPAYLATLLWPNALGNPFQPSFALYPSEFFEMLGLYLGLAPAALAAYGLYRARGRAAAALWAVLFLGLFLATGENNPLYLSLQKTLRLDFLRVPARFGLLILWALWLAAAAGFRAAAAGRSAGFRAVLVGVTLLDLGLVASRWLYTDDPQRVLPAQTDLAAKLAQGTRIATGPDIPSSNKTILYRIRNATGYEAFYPARVAVYTSRNEGRPAADGSRTYITRWDTPEMAKLGVRHYLTLTRQDTKRPETVRGATFLYENPDAGPLVRGARAWEERKPEHLAATAGPSALVVSQGYYPGWRAWSAAGELPVSVEDGLFPRIVAPDGTRVHVRFAPGAWRIGLLMTLIAGLMLTGIAELRLRAWMS